MKRMFFYGRMIFIAILSMLVLMSCSKNKGISLAELSGTWYAKTSNNNIPQIEFDISDGSYEASGLLFGSGTFKIAEHGLIVELKPSGQSQSTRISATSDSSGTVLSMPSAIGDVLFTKTKPETQERLAYEDAVEKNDAIKTTISFNTNNKPDTAEDEPDDKPQLYVSAVPEESDVLKTFEIRCTSAQTPSSLDDFYVCNIVSEKYIVSIFKDEEMLVPASEEEISKVPITVSFTLSKDLMDMLGYSNDISQVDIYEYVKEIGAYRTVLSIEKNGDSGTVTANISHSGKYILAMKVEESDNENFDDILQQQEHANVINAYLKSSDWANDEHSISFKSDQSSSFMIFDDGTPIHYSLSKISYDKQRIYKFKFSMDGAGDGVDATLSFPKLKDFNENSNKLQLTITWLNGQTVSFMSDYTNLGL